MIRQRRQRSTRPRFHRFNSTHETGPVILRREDWSDWLDGLPDAAGLLCRPYPDLMVKDRTADRWVQRKASVNE